MYSSHHHSHSEFVILEVVESESEVGSLELRVLKYLLHSFPYVAHSNTSPFGGGATNTSGEMLAPEHVEGLFDA